MKVYILIRKMDDFESSAVATPHLSLEAAQAAMADDFKDILEVFGLSPKAIANADISVDVFDLDSQDLAEDGKTFEADRLDADYQKLGKEPGWRAVY